MSGKDEKTSDKRERTMTDKGYEYTIDLKKKERSRMINALNNTSKTLQDKIQSSTDQSEVKTIYTKWMSEYDQLLEFNVNLQNMIKDMNEKHIDTAWFEDYNSKFLGLKQSVQQWFLLHKALTVPEKHKTTTQDDARSNISARSARSRGSARSSQLSAAKLKEETRKAELLARAKSLEEQKNIEEAKLRLKFKEEELKLKTEIQVSEAKSKVIDEIERSVHDDREQLERLVLNAPTNEPTVKAEPKPLQTFSFLDPTVPAWNPGSTFVADTHAPVDSTQTPIARELNKPKADIQKFDGNPMHYKRFLRQFDSRIVANTDSYEERLNFLLQFTIGEPHRIAMGFSHLDASVGYDMTFREFEERYGDPDVIAHSYVKRAMDWPQIKPENAKGLDEYAIFLQECLYAVNCVEAAKVLEYSENLKYLVMKLPYSLHEKWRNIVYETKTANHIVKFETLVNFVKREAKKANDPVYGREVLSASSAKKQESKAKSTGASRKSFATTSSETGKVSPSNETLGIENAATYSKNAFSTPCLFCEGSSHSLSKCTKLMEKSLKDRYAFLKSKGLCFACLKYGHTKSFCRSKLTCLKCSKGHPYILHVDPRVQNSDTGNSSATSDHSLKTATNSTTCMRAGNTLVQALPILPVRVKHIDSDKYVETYAFLDCSSNATFCSEEIMHQLNLRGKTTKLDLTTMGHQDVKESMLFSGLEVSDLNGENSIELPPVYLQETLPVSEKDIVSVESVEKLSYLRDVNLQRIGNHHVGLLIGINVPRAMEPWNVIPSVDNGPFAVETLLGWVINGPISTTCDDETEVLARTCNRIKVSPFVSLDEQIKNHYNHDFNERIIDDVESPSREDKQFLGLVSESIHLQDGHYIISLPFKSKDNMMPNNRAQAKQRLVLLGKRFENDNSFREDYGKFMDKLISIGHAQKVPESELSRDDGHVWYLPHHGVYHPKKKKLRVVFDCAAKFKGASLNERLLQGPNLTSSLVGTLLRFRQDEIAVMGDIDSMFHQVRLPNCDSNYLRFLWWENGDTSKEPIEYWMTVHIFGATSSPSCVNFALRRTAEDGIGHFGQSVIDTVLNNFYVDDCLKSVKTVDEGIALVKDLRSLLHRGGFNIAKWISNSREVVRSIPLSDRSKEIMDMDLDHQDLPIDRALGVSWCVEMDKFVFKVSVSERLKTRRGILSMLSSVYDPLGFLAPFMLRAKLILQELCKLNLGWDDAIPTELEAKWSAWFHDLKLLSEFSVDRCLKVSEFQDVRCAELHHFSDASEIGYGTVSYLRLENQYGDVHCSFLIGKSRVCPLKQTTIPRLELTAATVAVRTNKLLLNELEIPIQRSIFWTDSMSVLRYIWNTSARFQTFVANRLAVIHEGSETENWRYINTKLNPADHASRGISTIDTLEKEWIRAPEFLWQSEDSWPQLPSDNFKHVSKSDPEVKQIVSTAHVSEVDENHDASSIIMKVIEYHSSWIGLKRNIAWILKVREMLRHRVRQRKQNYTKDSAKTTSESHRETKLSVQDLESAEKSIIVFIQKCEFQDEINSLVEKKVLKANSSIRKLDPIIDEGLIRVGGRLVESKMPEESKHPLIVPKTSYVATLILRHIHLEFLHCGRNQMLSRLREKYWIPNAPSLIRSLISKCVTCRRVSKPLSQQKMSNLPEDRVRPDEPPFTVVGVDYFGPFEVKQRRSRIKRYGVIFTCMASRAVHLEVAASLDTDSFINVLRRFIARRGQVKKIRSDNGTNFVGAERELKRALDEWNVNQIEQCMLSKGIEWLFNPPYGSHFGGIWERLIRSIRKAMNSVLREQVLDDDGLQTLMCEIESTLNDRPITMNTDNPNDIEALTPNHILLLKRKPCLPSGLFVKTDNYCRRRWRQIQYMSDLFWSRWMKEYLPILQERQKWNRERRNLMVGDVVIVADSNAPRNSWPVGIVLETFPDKNGLVRQVKIKVGSNTLTRPVDKLCTILEHDI